MMNATLMCLALLAPGYGEKDIIKRIEDGGGRVKSEKGLGTEVSLPTTNTDAYLSDLCELPNLTRLILVSSAITDDGLGLVSQVPELKELNLSDTDISDKGLRHLESMKGLEGLAVFRSRPRPYNFTDEGIARLQKALPRCKVYFEGIRGF